MSTILHTVGQYWTVLPLLLVLLLLYVGFAMRIRRDKRRKDLDFTQSNEAPQPEAERQEDKLK